MRATYSPEDNKLRIYPEGTRVDSILTEAEYAEFKRDGYKWAGKQECFVAARWTPSAEDWALELAETIEDEDYSAEERSADRAERFNGYLGKRRDEAHGHADTFEAGPSAFGHQIRQRAERQAARHDRHRGRALNQWSKAEYWQQRTAGVIAHALYRSSPEVRRGRLIRLETEQRRYGNMSDRWKAHYELRIAYERAMLENEGGMAAEVEMIAGGFIGRAQIDRVNKSNVTGRVVSVQIGRKVFNIERLGADVYRAPTEEELAAFHAATKERKAKEKAARPTAPPLINPTEEDAERLQAIWNANEKARFDARPRGEEFKPSAVRRMTQAEYSERSKGTYARCRTIDVSEQLKERRRNAMGYEVAGRVTVFKVRRSDAMHNQLYRADCVLVITDKPQKPLPWDLVDEIREEQPTFNKLLPQIEEIDRICRLGWLPKEGTPEIALFNDARYLGWVYFDSMTQFGMTDAGRAALAKFNEIKADGGTPTATGILTTALRSLPPDSQGQLTSR
ncbi:DUF3560 domain-containing protein [Anatilimnocola floriformis]|uniref:DUF3560 domain-containing protein n=1 Tax=Anatilimnocola floriformis TaxID=2948575 RepID=UPI0020C580F9|nr:DUF3560 domain-containing protein [Anatilimnocola floriformis]